VSPLKIPIARPLRQLAAADGGRIVVIGESAQQARFRVMCAFVDVFFEIIN
jgi:hypothetical protein